MFCGEIREKKTFIHIILSIKDGLKQQIHFNGNTFENKLCRCNEGSLYILPDWISRNVRKHTFWNVRPTKIVHPHSLIRVFDVRMTNMQAICNQ